MSGARASRWGNQALVHLPERTSTPFAELARRGVLALVILLTSTLIVYLDRDSYADHANGDGVSLLDALYYSTVTITTTGYGDITPVADHARVLNALIVTPLRISFLVLLVGTTLEVLANEGRRAFRDAKWRKTMRNHTVVMGYGTMGKSAVATLRRHDRPSEKIVVIDRDAIAVADANRAGFATFHGDVASRELLRRAEIPKAREIIITVNHDATSILTTLTVRQLNPSAHVTVAVREQDNVALVRQSGADSVITSSDAVGRIVGMSSLAPHIGVVIEDLLSSAEGLEVAQRLVQADEVGLSPDDIRGDRVLGVIRNQTLRRYFDPTVAKLELGDELVVARRSQLQAMPQPRPVPGRDLPA